MTVSKMFDGSHNAILNSNGKEARIKELNMIYRYFRLQSFRFCVFTVVDDLSLSSHNVVVDYVKNHEAAPLLHSELILF